MVFTEFDRHPNFVHEDILTDVIPYSQTHSSQWPSRIDYVCNDIAASLMGQ